MSAPMGTWWSLSYCSSFSSTSGAVGSIRVWFGLPGHRHQHPVGDTGHHVRPGQVVADVDVAFTRRVEAEAGVAGDLFDAEEPAGLVIDGVVAPGLDRGEVEPEEGDVGGTCAS